jgi:flagellar basal-body rod protein FlgC
MGMDPSIAASASGLRAQSLRMKVIAENLANADSVATTPGGDPYRRKVATFKSVVDAKAGTGGVAVSGVTGDRTDFPRVYQPGNPAADAAGYVRTPNVNMLLESADMKAAQRAYEANLNAIESARSMTMRTLDLLK